MLIQMRLLIIKLSSIGDIVHTLPALAAIKERLPEAEISWAAESRSAEILRNNPLLSRLIEVDTRSLRRKSVLGKTIKTARRQLRDLRASDFDLAIDFQGLFKSASVSRFSGARFRAGFSRKHLREPACRHFYTDRFDVTDKAHVIRKNLELAENALGAFLQDPEFKLNKEVLRFPISTDSVEELEAKEISKSAGDDFVLLNPAGGWSTKLWPAENYGHLADALWEKFSLTSIICTAPNEKDLAQRAIAASHSGRVFTGHPSIKGFYELAKHARAYVGGDTAPTHLAVAASCPVIGIFGPTEWWRNGSPKKEDLCIERTDIGCRIDCHRRTCGNWICMDIPVENVLLGIQSRLGL